MLLMKKLVAILFLLLSFFSEGIAQSSSGFRVVGYYCGTTIPVDSFEIEKLTHIIFCFGHLEGNRFSIHSAVDSAPIQRMVELKRRNPKMKVMLSLGGWGGCKTCSDVFGTEQG